MTTTETGDARDRAVVDRLRESEGPTRVFGIVADGVAPGRATMSTTPGSDALNGFGAAHGGVLFTLAYTACACNGRDVATVAQSATIAFLSPGRAGERITADAREVALVGRSGSYQVIVSGGDGRTIATFQGVSRATGGSALNRNTGR